MAYSYSVNVGANHRFTGKPASSAPGDINNVELKVRNSSGDIAAQPARTYTSANSNCTVSVTNNVATVTSIKPGTCQINASVPSYTGWGTKTVSWNIIAKYAFHGIPAASLPGDSYAVSMTVQNSSNVDIASQPGLAYAGESPNVCTIDASGNVSNVGLGLCKMKVTIAAYDNLVVRKEWNVSALVGQTFTAQAGASGDNVIFTSETPQVCSVQTDGFVDNIKPGTCTVRATNVTNGNAVTTQTWTVVADADRDGIADDVDNCPFAANNDQADLDTDGTGDACDTDMDGDNVDNNLDNCPLVANADQAVSIIPGIGQACYDPNGDQDNDGIADAVDNCPFAANPGQLNTNQAQEITDGDTLRGDACDTDDDGDGVEDGVDNCPLVSNADQLDTNQDGVGDACERKFVDGELGSDSNDCSSWASACATITRGIEAAQDDGLAQVFIKQGVYRPLTTISLQPGISLIGGFAGGELQASEGDGGKNVTVISGDAGDDVNQDANGVISSVADVRNSNLARLLRAQDTGLTAADEIQLIGLTLNAADSTGNGAALFASNARVTVIGGRMQANRANLGGGIYAQNGAIVQVRGTQLVANQAVSGAAVYNNAATVVLNGTTVADNATTAGNGGALFSTGEGNLELQRSTLQNNSTNGGGTSGNGAALYANGGSVTIGNATRFADNKAGSGAAVYLAGSATAEIKNTEFDGNIANGNGGAVVFNATGVTHQLDSSLFVVNRAAASGGAVYVNAGNHVNSVNTTFYQNKAASNAAGDAASGQTGHGGAIALGSSSGNVAVIHNTVVENVSWNGNGGGVYAASGGLQLTASLLAGNLANSGANAYFSTAVDGGYNLLGFNGEAGLVGSLGSTLIVPTAAQADSLAKLVQTPLVTKGGDGYASLLRMVPIVGGSPARDGVPAAHCALAVDGRGEQRPDQKSSNDGTPACDVGAYEFTVLSCAEDAQRRYAQGETFIKSCEKGLENYELNLGYINTLWLLLLAVLGVARARSWSVTA